jgi:thiamine kinase-like enzyme
MLAHGEVVYYLIERGLISPRAVVEGQVVIRDLSRRNHNFAVECSRGPSFLVKQGLGADGRAGITHEAVVYRTLSAVPGLGPYLTCLLDYEPREHILVLELLPRARDLHNHCRQLGRFPIGKATAIADALGILHTLTREEPRYAPSEPPSVLRLHLPDLTMLHELSGPAIELLQAVQRIQGLADALAGLQEDWRIGSFTHGDLRLDNVVVFRPTGSKRGGIKLVDWEAAGPGDPCWDLGSVLAHYLSLWATSVPVGTRMPLRRALGFARYSLASMRPSIQAFWRRYTERAAVETDTADAWLTQAVRMAAARLVQSAFEEAQVTPRLSTSALLQVQLASNLMREPEAAAQRLLHFPLKGAVQP